MKIKLILALLISNFVLADDIIIDGNTPLATLSLSNDGNGGEGGYRPNDGLGAQATPIDDYAPILVILGITLAGTVLYRKQKQLN